MHGSGTSVGCLSKAQRMMKSAHFQHHSFLFLSIQHFHIWPLNALTVVPLLKRIQSNMSSFGRHLQNMSTGNILYLDTTGHDFITQEKETVWGFCNVSIEVFLQMKCLKVIATWWWGMRSAAQ